jgi:hypothetical protein
MWRITAFAPAAALLLLLAWMTLARRRAPDRKHTVYLTLALSLFAWLSIVLPMQFKSANFESYRFVAQRDIGYYLGSALFLSAPFAVVSALSLAARRLNLGRVAAGGSAFVLATAGSIFLPGLFAAGWIIGCVFAGYPACI